MVGHKFEEPTPPYALRFLLSADQNIGNILASLRLYVHQTNTLDATRQGKCVFWINKKPIADVEDFLLSGEQGKELWLSHLSKNDMVLFVVVWEKEDPQISYATIEIESDHGIDTDI